MRNWILGFVVLVGLCGGAWGQVIWYVDDGATGAETGDSSISDPLEDGSVDHPFDAIQEGIDAAVGGDTVMVAIGIYTGEGNRDIDFEGKAITVISENGAASCIIDCQGMGSDPHRGFYFHTGENADSVLDGFTITNGYENNGGGIYCRDSSSPTIQNCVIENNTATSHGGGIYVWDSNLTVKNCLIYNNSARVGGGGISLGLFI